GERAFRIASRPTEFFDASKFESARCLTEDMRAADQASALTRTWRRRRRVRSGRARPTGWIDVIATNMKSRRAYRMSARAAAVAERGRRTLAAPRGLFVEMAFAEITLQATAARAGVTLQTVLRRFGSKPRLIAAAAEEGMAEIEAQRGQAPVGNP